MSQDEFNLPRKRERDPDGPIHGFSAEDTINQLNARGERNMIEDFDTYRTIFDNRGFQDISGIKSNNTPKMFMLMRGSNSFQPSVADFLIQVGLIEDKITEAGTYIQPILGFVDKGSQFLFFRINKAIKADDILAWANLSESIFNRNNMLLYGNTSHKSSGSFTYKIDEDVKREKRVPVSTLKGIAKSYKCYGLDQVGEEAILAEKEVALSTKIVTSLREGERLETVIKSLDNPDVCEFVSNSSLSLPKLQYLETISVKVSPRIIDCKELYDGYTKEYNSPTRSYNQTPAENANYKKEGNHVASVVEGILSTLGSSKPVSGTDSNIIMICGPPSIGKSLLKTYLEVCGIRFFCPTKSSGSLGYTDFNSDIHDFFMFDDALSPDEMGFYINDFKSMNQPGTVLRCKQTKQTALVKRTIQTIIFTNYCDKCLLAKIEANDIIALNRRCKIFNMGKHTCNAIVDQGNTRGNKKFIDIPGLLQRVIKKQDSCVRKMFRCPEYMNTKEINVSAIEIDRDSATMTLSNIRYPKLGPLKFPQLLNADYGQVCNDFKCGFVDYTEMPAIYFSVVYIHNEGNSLLSIYNPQNVDRSGYTHDLAFLNMGDTIPDIEKREEITQSDIYDRPNKTFKFNKNEMREFEMDKLLLHDDNIKFVVGDTIVHDLTEFVEINKMGTETALVIRYKGFSAICKISHAQRNNMVYIDKSFGTELALIKSMYNTLRMGEANGSQFNDLIDTLHPEKSEVYKILKKTNRCYIEREKQEMCDCGNWIAEIYLKCIAENICPACLLSKHAGCKIPAIEHFEII